MHWSLSVDVSLYRPILLFKTMQTLQRCGFVLALLWIAIRVHLGVLELCMNLQQNLILRTVELHSEVATDVRRNERRQPIHHSV
jgi:hypothetical protein